MPKAIISLQGGLGNQLFQFSFAQYLIQRKYQVTYNAYALTHPYPGDTPRTYELQPLQLKTEAYAPLALRLLGSRLNIFKPFAHYSDQPAFNKHPDPTGNIIANGYWQHPDYAQAGRAHIIDAMPEVIIKNLGISLGIRRGDYLSNPHAAAFHNTLSLDYYRHALALLPLTLPIMIFTDDPEWVRQVFIPELRLEHRALLAPELSNWDTLSLMSRAPYHVIANSSFHWWGAFLSKAPQQVIAPVEWNRNFHHTPCAIIPSTWTTLPVSQ